MFKISHGRSQSLEALANLHYSKIVARKSAYTGKGLPYELNSIVRRVKRVQKNCAGNELNYIKDLVDKDFALLKRILIGKPEELHRLAKTYDNKVTKGIYPKITYRKLKADHELFGDKLSHIFNYDQFVNKESEWNCYELAKSLGIDVCIYCNRNYTYTVSEGRDYHVRPEFDHFLPKSNYPFLAISFYNLIPSCHICNANLKRNIDFTITDYLHPYIYSLNDAVKFTVQFQEKGKYSADEIKTKYGVMFFMDRTDNFKLKLMRSSPLIPDGLYKKAKNNIKVFRLEELYNCHKDLVSEMIMNSIIYSEDKIDQLLKDYGGILFNSREDVLRHISKNYPNELNLPKRPFSKITRDIQLEFGIKY